VRITPDTSVQTWRPFYPVSLDMSVGLGGALFSQPSKEMSSLCSGAQVVHCASGACECGSADN
jgi:hypothetical protein